MKKILLITNCISLFALVYLNFAGCSSPKANTKGKDVPDEERKKVSNDYKYTHFKSEKDLMVFIDKNHNNKNLRLNTVAVNAKVLSNVFSNLIKKEKDDILISIVFAENEMAVAFSTNETICLPDGKTGNFGGRPPNICCPPNCRTIDLKLLTSFPLP